MNKKAIAILGAIFILIIGTLGFLIYSKYSKKSTTTEVPAKSEQKTSTSEQGNSAPIDQSVNSSAQAQGASLFSKLSTEQVVSPTLFFNGGGVTYFTTDGLLMLADLNTENGVTQLVKKRNLNIKQKSNISKILWPKKGDDFIAEFSSNGKKTWSYFNSKIGDYVDFPTQIISVNWAPEGDKIFYIWSENSKSTLNISNPDLKNWKKISDMWESDNDISVSHDGLNIVFYSTKNTLEINKIKLTTPDAKLWKDLVKEGYNSGALWSPDSQKFLFQKKDKNNLAQQIWYYDILSGESRNLGLFTTITKVVWGGDSKTIFGSVPKSNTSGNGSVTEDVFVRLDTQNYEKKEFKNDSYKIDGHDLFLNLNNNILFFKNNQDNLLYSLKLD